MELRSFAILCVGVGALMGCASAGDQSAGAGSIFETLREGGNVLVMRHGDSPHDQAAPVGMTEGCRLGEGRGLSAKGFFESREMGALLAQERISIGKTYTSRMCRSWDTAVLVAAGSNVEPSDSQMTTDTDAIAAFKKQIEADLAANLGANILLVSHSNIAPLYGAYAVEGEEEVPSGYAYAVDPENWRALARIYAGQTGAAKTVTVEVAE